MEQPESNRAASGSLERLIRRIPVVLLCFVAHMTGFGVALTIGKDFWPYILCATTGMACVVIGMHRDDPPNKAIDQPTATSQQRPTHSSS